MSIFRYNGQDWTWRELPGGGTLAIINEAGETIARIDPDGLIIATDACRDAAIELRRQVSVPEGAVTFTVRTFGQYGPRGFDPSAMASAISDIPVSNWPGNWLAPETDGRTRRVEFFDESGASLAVRFF